MSIGELLKNMSIDEFFDMRSKLVKIVKIIGYDDCRWNGINMSRFKDKRNNMFPENLITQININGGIKDVNGIFILHCKYFQIVEATDREEFLYLINGGPVVVQDKEK